MQNSKLFNLLRIFKQEELQALDDFLASPFFNKNETILGLWRCILPFAPDFRHASLKKSLLWKQLYPDEAFDRYQFNHLTNYLFRLIERFLAINQFSEVYQKQKALEFYVEHRLEKHYRLCHKQLKFQLEKLPFQDEVFHDFQFEQARLSNQQFLMGRQRIFDPAIQEASVHLDFFYLIHQLKFISEMLDRQKKLVEHYDLESLHAVDLLLGKYEHSGNPYLILYRQLIRMLREEENEAHYFSYRELLNSFLPRIRPDDLRQLFFYAINYCVRKIAGGKAFHQHLFELYTTGLEQEILLEDGVLSPWTYKNIVLLGLGLEKISWVEQFIETYAERLPNHFRQDAYHYNIAVLYYAKKDYSEAMTHLNQVVYSDISYKLWSKELLLKIYFETQETEPLLSLLTSFEALIKRNNAIPKSQKAAYRNFLKIVAKLTKGKGPLKKIREQIIQTNELRERKWLLAQCV